MTKFSLWYIQDAGLAALKAGNFTQLRELHFSYEQGNFPLLAETLSSLRALRKLVVAGIYPNRAPPDDAVVTLPSLTYVDISLWGVIGVRSPKIAFANFQYASHGDLALLTVLDSSTKLDTLYFGTEEWQEAPVATSAGLARLSQLFSGSRQWSRLTTLWLVRGLPSPMLPWLASCCPALETFVCAVVPDDFHEDDVILALQHMPDLARVRVLLTELETPADWPKVERFPSTDEPQAVLEQLESLELSVCTDAMLQRLFCNALQHLHLSSSRAVGSLAAMLSVSATLSLQCLTLHTLPTNLDVNANDLRFGIRQLRVEGSEWKNDNILTVVKQLPNLEKLALIDCRVTSELLLSLSKTAFPKLQLLIALPRPNVCFSGECSFLMSAPHSVAIAS